jgi:drug/metabolite transporter (DMT)-like permease
LPFAIGEYLSGQQTYITTTSVFGVVYTALFVTVIGYLALFWALGKSSSSNVAAMMYFQPIAGAIVAWLWLNEEPTVGFFVGSALTFVGVWLVIRSPQSSKSVSQ